MLVDDDPGRLPRQQLRQLRLAGTAAGHRVKAFVGDVGNSARPMTVTWLTITGRGRPRDAAAVSGRSGIALHRIDPPARGRQDQVIAHVRELWRGAQYRDERLQSAGRENVTRPAPGASPKRPPRYAFDRDDDEISA
jgi:hypothetical protein